MIQSVPVPVVLAPVQLPQPRNQEASRKLAVTQLVIGVLALILGLVALQQQFPVLSGIWSGLWILITGGIGICSTRNNNKLNCVYIVFSIISTCVTGIAIIAALVTIVEVCSSSRYNCAAALGLHVPLEIILVMEFIVSIVASVFCCQNSSCCQGSIMSTQMMIQQQPNTNAMVVYPYQQQTIPTPGHLQQQDVPMYVLQYGAQVPPSSTQPLHHEGAPIPNAPSFVPTVYDQPPPAYSDKPGF